jgi:hypothetical protein
VTLGHLWVICTLGKQGEAGLERSRVATQPGTEVVEVGSGIRFDQAGLRQASGEVV